MSRQFAIFDMDGTLVDSMGLWDNVFQEYLESRGITEDLREILLRIKTMSVLDGAREVVRQFGLSEEPEAIEAEMNRLMERHYREDVAVKPGIPEFLQDLKSRGVKMCVASTSGQALIELCLDRQGIRSMFEFCLSSELVGPGKEKPDLYLEAARRLGAVPENTTVFEDALYAMRTAKKAGFRVVGIHDAAEEANWPAIQEFADETMIFE